jgi:SAM-dependent methyltransferase
MKPRLTSLLLCPACRASLNLQATAHQGEEVLEGFLDCTKCSAHFPIRNGIPRFVASDQYVSTFSFEWKKWRRVQFDTVTRRSSEAAFVASTGVPPAELANKTVLDAGCGTGRFMDLAARAGAEVVGVDLSLAIEVAQENLGHLPNCHFVQADLLRPPFASASFDFIYSIGVLHHTPNTRQAFRSLLSALKPGGDVALWVYPRYRLAETFRFFPGRVNEVLALDVNYKISPRWEGLVRRWAMTLDRITETSSAIQRSVTSRLPAPWLYALCHVAIPLYFLYRIPIFFPLRLVTKIAMDRDPEWRVLDTFDWYSPRYQWKHTYDEVRGWFDEAGLQEFAILPRPVAARGKKPAH